MLSLILLVGLVLRGMHLDRVAVEHFDEGVYASNVWFEEPDHHRYPDRHLYAPPMLPTMLEWTHLVFGTGSLGLILPSLTFGILTIFMVYRIARDWFGQIPALACAALVALSDVHALYSRTMLTDVMLTFWILLAVRAWEQACRHGSLKWAAKAGLFTALAWWTKYNGWLPMVIAVSGTLGWFLLERWKRSFNRAIPKAGAVMLLVAVGLWLPVWWGLQEFGGYSAVAANHAQYLVGFSGWFDSLQQQFLKQRALTGWPTVLSLLCGLGMVFVPAVKQIRHSDNRKALLLSSPMLTSMGLACLLVALTAWAGVYVTLAVTAVAGLLLELSLLWRVEGKSRDLKLGEPIRLPLWLISAWFVGLSLTTPLYHPYPRLTLPWLIASCLGTAALIRWWSGWLNRNVSQSPHKPILPELVAVLGLASLIVAVSVRFPLWREQGVIAWQPRTSFREMATEILADSHAATDNLPRPDQWREAPFVIYVYAEPGLFYYLRAQHPAAAPLGTLAPFAPEVPRHPVPTFLLIGPQGEKLLPDDPVWQQHADLFELTEEYTYDPSLLVRLDERIDDYPPPETQSVRVYRVK